MKQHEKFNIAWSIWCALAMIFTSYMLGDADNRQIVMFAFIALWFVPFNYMQKLTKQEKETSSC